MFKDRLKKIRLEKGLTMVQVAERLDISYPVYSQWERGKRIPKQETLQRLANALDVPLDYLTGEIYQIDLSPYEPSEDDIQAVKELIDNYFKERKK